MFGKFFWGPMPWIIEAAAIVSILVKDWLDFAIILVLLLFNAVLGFLARAAGGECRPRKVALFHRHDLRETRQASWQNWFHAPLDAVGGRLGKLSKTE